MKAQNHELLRSQKALSELVQSKLPGLFALRVRDIAEQVQERVQRLQEVRQDLAGREDMGEEEVQEEWTQVLEDTHEIDEDPIPESALEDVKLSAGDLFALDWLLEREDEDNG